MPPPQPPEKFVMPSSTHLDTPVYWNQPVYTMKNILIYCFEFPAFPVG